MLKLIVFFGVFIVFVVGSKEERFLKFNKFDESSDELDLNSNEFSSNITDKGKKPIKYDLLVISQSWPQTACWNLNKKWTNSTTVCCPCDMPEAKINWTLHGVWPSNSKGKHPSFCNNVKFNVKLLNKALLSEMEEKWSSFNLNMESSQFWKHEWDKHGTCAMNLPSTNTLPKFFSKSLQLLDQFNIGKILAEAGMLPGKKYDFKDVIYVIEQTLGVLVHIDCAAHSMSKESYLNEIEVCLDTNFELTDCPSNKSDCKGQVWYPEPRQECKRFN